MTGRKRAHPAGGSTSVRGIAASIRRASQHISLLDAGAAATPNFAAALASVRAFAVQLIEAVDAASTRESLLLSLPRELQVRVLRECTPYDLARLECCSRAFHTRAVPNGLTVVEEAVLSAREALPAEIARRVPLKRSAAEQLCELHGVLGVGESWLLGAAGFGEDEGFLFIAPDYSRAAVQMSLVMETMAHAAVHPVPLSVLKCLPDHAQQLAESGLVRRRALRVLHAAFASEGASAFSVATRVPPGSLVVELVRQALATAGDHRQMAFQTALAMAEVMVLDLSCAPGSRTWHQSSYSPRAPSNNAAPTLWSQRDVSAETSANYTRAAQLLRAAWDYHRAEVAGDEGVPARPQLLLLGGHCAFLLSETRHVSDAEEVLRVLIPLTQQAHGAWHIETVTCRALLVEVLLYAQKWDAALAVLRELAPTRGRVELPQLYHARNYRVGSNDFVREVLQRLRAARRLDVAEALLRALLALDFEHPSRHSDREWHEWHLDELLVEMKKLDVVVMLQRQIERNEIDEARAASEGLEFRPGSCSDLRYQRSPESARLRMQLLHHYDETGRGEEAAAMRDLLVRVHVDKLCSDHDALMPAAQRDGLPQAWQSTLPIGAVRTGDGELPECHRAVIRTDAYWELALSVGDLARRMEELLRARVASARAAHGDDDERTWWAIGRWMLALDEHGKADAALPLAREFAAHAERHLGARHRTTLEAQIYVSELAAAIGQKDEALDLLREKVYPVLRRIFREADPARAAFSKSPGMLEALERQGKALCVLLVHAGKHAEAVAVLRTRVHDMETPKSTEGERDSDPAPRDWRTVSRTLQMSPIKMELAAALGANGQQSEECDVYRELLGELSLAASTQHHMPGPLDTLHTLNILHAVCALTLSRIVADEEVRPTQALKAGRPVAPACAFWRLPPPTVSCPNLDGAGSGWSPTRRPRRLPGCEWVGVSQAAVRGRRHRARWVHCQGPRGRVSMWHVA